MMMRKQKRRLLRIAGLALAAFLIIGTVAVTNYRYLERQAARIPASIRQDLTFSPFVVTLDNKEYKAIDYKLTEVEKGVQLFSFIVQFEGQRVTVSEYVQPPQFTDIPEYKDRFLDNVIKKTSTVQTANGTIYLGQQTKQNDKQLGIMLERGLVILFNPEKELSHSQWRRLGDQFDIQKISN